MGLGLSIVANIAERHAGNITVARNGPRGVKFTMTFPRLAKIDPAGRSALWSGRKTWKDCCRKKPCT